eukprot:TRINITY_DN8074_c0_g1_i4.p1 TRINITY_DN8074_c0_g1~~TRINITY_DN8074_c0_g1_i4.p1  ORF type:complete len:407 (-),score=156.22 TRINITY_DN8074_c0_g1_i4:92-1312(-)
MCIRDRSYIMGLIFKLMQHYTVGQAEEPNANTPAGSLLEWVKPRCAAHKEVKNYTSSWKDGKAIVALWNYLITEDPELYEWLKEKNGEMTIDINKCSTDTEGAIMAAVNRFNKVMEVPLMVTPHDMIQCDVSFKQTNQVYLAEIKNAFAHWYPEVKKAYEISQEEDDGDLKNIQIGLEYYENALRALKTAQTSSTSMTDEILTDASEDMSACDNSDSAYDKICDDARVKLNPNDDQYDHAKDLFEKAQDAFKLVKGKKGNDLNKKWDFKTKMFDCKNKIEDCDNYKDQTHDNLDVKLDELRKHWKGKKTLEFTLDAYQNELDSIQTAYDEILDKTIRSFEGTKNERQRRENTAKGRSEVVDEIEKILKYKDMFETTENVVDSEEDRLICQETVSYTHLTLPTKRIV